MAQKHVPEHVKKKQRTAHAGLVLFFQRSPWASQVITWLVVMNTHCIPAPWHPTTRAEVTTVSARGKVGTNSRRKSVTPITITNVYSLCFAPCVKMSRNCVTRFSPPQCHGFRRQLSTDTQKFLSYAYNYEIILSNKKHNTL